MTDILGHDIDGRPLWAGDVVVVLRILNEEFTAASGISVGDKITACGQCPDHEQHILIQESDAVSVCSRDVRKLHNDHRPANESFGEMTGKFTNNRVETTNDQ